MNADQSPLSEPSRRPNASGRGLAILTPNVTEEEIAAVVAALSLASAEVPVPRASAPARTMWSMPNHARFAPSRFRSWRQS